VRGREDSAADREGFYRDASAFPGQLMRGDGAVTAPPHASFFGSIRRRGSGVPGFCDLDTVRGRSKTGFRRSRFGRDAANPADITRETRTCSPTCHPAHFQATESPSLRRDRRDGGLLLTSHRYAKRGRRTGRLGYEPLPGGDPFRRRGPTYRTARTRRRPAPNFSIEMPRSDPAATNAALRAGARLTSSDSDWCQRIAGFPMDRAHANRHF